MTTKNTRSIRENEELCDGKKREWNSLKKRFRNQVYSMTMMRKRGAAVITVSTGSDLEKVQSGQATLDKIVSSDEFKALGFESYETGLELNSYQVCDETVRCYDLRIRIQF